MGKSIAYFITPHGFGHATRASAVMSAVLEREPTLHFDIFTEVPEWVFRDSIDAQFTYRPLHCDVGMVQKDPFSVDLPATVRRLGELLPFRAEQVERLANQVMELGCRLVVCDVAALGIAVARVAKLPSVLIENFTWDWIYEGYLDSESGFIPFIDYLKDQYAQADFHLQTEPLCDPLAQPDVRLAPISRKPKNRAAVVRARLGIPQENQTVLITTGGIPGTFPYLARLADFPRVSFILPGAAERLELQGNCVLLPHHSNFFHPDLTHASDAVVGKAGYSTIAEAYAAGIPLAYVMRDGFRESPEMDRFIQREMRGFPIREQDYAAGDWIERIPELLRMPKMINNAVNGADQAAEILLSLVEQPL
ncbi:MAG TPA: hypothetical protein VHO48_06340 [Anaerolineaceae bacterium]|nr:hypothetical protein [Anaerolineaceae bacterium]